MNLSDMMMKFLHIQNGIIAMMICVNFQNYSQINYLESTVKVKTQMIFEGYIGKMAKFKNQKGQFFMSLLMKIN